MSVLDMAELVLTDAGLEAQWRQDRCGHLTGSRIHVLLAKRKDGKPSDTIETLAAELIAERLSNTPAPDGWKSAEMLRGLEKEHLARTSYDLYSEDDVEHMGRVFVKHPTIKWAGCSPDGLVGDEGVLSVKCPNTATHLKTLDAIKSGEGWRGIKPEYFTQLQWELACHPGRKWCDFLSFDDRLPTRMQRAVIRCYRDGSFIGDLENKAREFLADVERRVLSYQKRFA